MAVSYKEYVLQLIFEQKHKLTRCRIATAKPFRFLVGDAAVEFFAHSDIVARQSKSLATLINGKMKEAHDGCACIEDVDVETFARFLEYCYTGDYAAAEHAIVLDAASIQQATTAAASDTALASQQGESNGFGGGFQEAELDPFDMFSYAGKKAKRKKAMAYGWEEPIPEAQTVPCAPLQQKAWQKFKNLSWEAPPQVPKLPTYQARANEEACEDYTDVFLSHARLYVFADVYGIERLRVLSLQKLHKSLTNFNLFPERATDIALLLQYTYHHTPERKDALDDLRALVVKYVCCNLEKIRSNDIFRETLKAENASSVDLLELLQTRLN